MRENVIYTLFDGSDGTDESDGIDELSVDKLWRALASEGGH
jgi:hypothetical protein